jgi:hypothetical protein
MRIPKGRPIAAMLVHVSRATAPPRSTIFPSMLAAFKYLIAEICAHCRSMPVNVKFAQRRIADNSDGAISGINDFTRAL